MRIPELDAMEVAFFAVVFVWCFGCFWIRDWWLRRGGGAMAGKSEPKGLFGGLSGDEKKMLREIRDAVQQHRTELATQTGLLKTIADAVQSGGGGQKLEITLNLKDVIDLVSGFDKKLDLLLGGQDEALAQEAQEILEPSTEKLEDLGKQNP